MRLPIQLECIMFRKREQLTEYLLLKRIESRGGFWQGVTGGYEEGDRTLMEAAKREIYEETAVEEKGILRVLPNIHFFQFQMLMKNIAPTEIFASEFVYGIEVRPEAEIKINNSGIEHDEYRWCTYTEAFTLLTYDNNKNALEKLDKILTKNKVK